MQKMLNKLQNCLSAAHVGEQNSGFSRLKYVISHDSSNTTHIDAHGSFTKFTDPEVLTEVFRKGRCVSRQGDSTLNEIFVIFRHFYEHEPGGDFKVDTVN